MTDEVRETDNAGQGRRGRQERGDLVDDLPESECVEDSEDDLSGDDEELDTWPSTADAAVHDRALADGASLSLALSLLALLLIAANLQVARFLHAQSEPSLVVSIAAAVTMALGLLIATPSWIAATAFALGSLVTGQRRWGLALLALLINVASGAIFQLVDWSK